MDSLSKTTPQETKLHFLDYWRIIRIRKTVILAVFLLVVITATLVTYMYPESYASTARIKIERDHPDVQGMEAQISDVYDPYFIQTEFEVIQSEVILGKVVETLDLDTEWGKKYNAGQKLKTSDAITILKRNMDLRPVRNTKLIEIRVFSDTPEEAAKIANTIADTYWHYREDQSKKLATSGISELKAQIEEQNKRIDADQKEVNRLRDELQIPDAMASADQPAPSLTAEALQQIQQLRIMAEAQYEEQEKLLTQLQSMDPQELRKALPTAVQPPDQQLNELLSELNIAQQKLISLKKDYSPDHPAYKAAQESVDDLDRKVDNRVEGILVGTAAQVESLKARVQGLDNQVEKAKAADLAFAKKSTPYYEAKRRCQQDEEFGKILQLKTASVKIDTSLPQSTLVTIVDKAVPVEKPERPNKPLNIGLGVVIGLVVGIGLAFFIEYLDTSVKTIDDVERTLQAPVLGVIPQNIGFLLDEAGETSHAEAYRVLRTNLLFSRKDEKLNSLAVVSAGAGEGKSTTVSNLAVIFAQNGNRVLLVDSDLRRPTLHKIFKVSNNIGLTNYLLGQNTLEEVIQTTSVPTLHLMASGKLPSSSLGILNSTQMKNLISELKKRYEYVFFDSPPIMGVSDASVLASEVDMTMQVIQYRRYPQPMNIRAKQMIEKVGGNLIGIVLNNINMAQDESYYYYSGYYHGYYYYSHYNKAEETKGPSDANGVPAGEKAKPEIKSKY